MQNLHLQMLSYVNHQEPPQMVETPTNPEKDGSP